MIEKVSYEVKETMKRSKNAITDVDSASRLMTGNAKRDAILRRHFTSKQRGMIVGREDLEDKPKIEGSLAKTPIRAMSVGRSTPLRRRAGAPAGRREELVQKLSKKRCASVPRNVTESTDIPTGDYPDDSIVVPHGIASSPYRNKADRLAKVRLQIPKKASGRSNVATVPRAETDTGRAEVNEDEALIVHHPQERHADCEEKFGGDYGSVLLGENKDSSVADSDYTSDIDAIASSSLDFRPLESKDEVVDYNDPSWDTHKVYFSEFVDSSKDGAEQECVNLFEEDAWPIDDSSFHGQSVFAGENENRNEDEASRHVVGEEKKEREMADRYDSSPESAFNLDHPELDPLGWPIQQEGFSITQAMESMDEKAESYDNNDTENLLRIRTNVMDIDSDVINEKTAASDSSTKIERLEAYMNSYEDDSSKGESTEEVDERSDGNEDDFGYELQDDDDDDETADLLVDNKTSLVDSSYFASPTVNPTCVAVNDTSKSSGDVLVCPAPLPPALRSVKNQVPGGLPPRGKISTTLPPPPPPPGSKMRKPKSDFATTMQSVTIHTNEDVAFLPDLSAPGDPTCSLDGPMGTPTDKESIEVESTKDPRNVNTALVVDSQKIPSPVNHQRDATKKDLAAQHERSAIPGDHKDTKQLQSARMTPPGGRPNPFETAVAQDQSLIAAILRFLGDPVVVCRLKMVNRTCHRIVEENEHILMRDAVRVGGMSMNVRPYFWLWVTLEKNVDYLVAVRSEDGMGATLGLSQLERYGRESKWHHVISRDVSRAFGNLPPHKTGARLRTDSIVRALVSWGRSRMMKKGVKGGGEAPLPPSRSHSADSDDASLPPTDTVSEWGSVTPVGSFSSGTDVDEDGKGLKMSMRRQNGGENRDLALSGNSLPPETKAELQGKLSFILHALSAAHQDVGYCQGMDYVVAHLLRVLQETIRWKAAHGTLPAVVKSTPLPLYAPPLDDAALMESYAAVDRSFTVEETCFLVMDSLFTCYGLRHFYWPELRCLKTCCLVFEKLIHIKLPVLADHFEHHELNVGLFALGWFQTLFLYLPSMPTATVCHMWDIWLVERSFKIFFRVGAAILFLSQPILLNHELEGMMNYLNTFPDATLLSPDILIACALQIKVTNRLLMELENGVTANL